MSVRDVIKNSVLESGASVQADFPALFTGLLLALVFGLLIFAVYRRFFAGVIYSRGFGITIVGMTVLTCMVTLAISTNVVISLGMVGALSIVRFRTAIKDPLDLLYLFWAITSGITVGAGMYPLALAAFVVMFLLVILFQAGKRSRMVYVIVAHYQDAAAYEGIIRLFKRHRYWIKSVTMQKERTELVAEILLRNADLDLPEKLRAVEGVDDVTLIQYNGEYHG